MISEDVRRVVFDDGVPGVYVSLRELKDWENHIEELKVQLRCAASALESWMDCMKLLQSPFYEDEISETRKLIADMRKAAK